MEEKKIQNSQSTIRTPIVVATTLVVGILIGATFFGGRRVGGDISRSSNKFKEILTYINRSYVDSVNTDSLVDYSITKMLEKLDPHTYYFPPQEADIARSQLESGFDGIGIEFNVFNDTLYVVTPLTGGPSETVGIQSGDAIIKANGNKLTGKDASSANIFANLRGKRGTEVKLEVKRRGFKDLLKFTVVRDKIPQYSVDAAYLMEDKKTAYIKINRFTETTYDEFKQHMTDLKKQGMKQLLLDLRGNPGGYMDRATDIVDELVGGKDVIVYTDGKDSRNNRKTYAGNDGMFEKGAIVVMVDEGSASASEIVSGSLQDYDRALIVGRRTFGKGLVQQPIQLSDGSELRLTISRYYIPSGRSIQKPYEKGHLENYEHELDERGKSGEYFIADSIKNNPKMRFKTKGGRVVYGGGGVTPDIFVPRDTSHITKYLLELYGKNILREYALNYANTNRKTLEKQAFTAFLKDFVISDVMLEEVKKMAVNAEVKFNASEYARSKEFIKLQIKANIARHVWQRNMKNGLNNEYYQIIYSQDPLFQTAIKQFVKAEKLEKDKKI
ncbi:carboxyl-terminal protease [Emticicia oligotrophica DSM 17448]|uniref:Carboxyl-terminal protease n=1 Tax=Emticicia oligotrophica (strain DSM 17448 / CIP 109782 / MTCC 6937 / GPTSA100-15) TaxID=929562 RepID=A0ABN4AKF9_EMTOG|nr:MULTISPECIES: S41 family peptidase [Emticicia]AFK02824.1 carboxyl-terminal protease [Emticicia oligotrophica DSM 17448]